MALSTKQQRFVDEYMIDFNGTQAAIRAGYSPRTAGSQAYQLVTDDRIQAELKSRTAKLSEHASITVAEIVERLAAILRANMRDYLRLTAKGELAVDFSRATPQQMAAVQTFEMDRAAGEDADGPKKFRLRLYDKIAAADKLLRYLGAYRDRVEHSGPDGGPIELAPPQLNNEQRLKAILSLLAKVKAERLAAGDTRDPEDDVRAAISGEPVDALEEERVAEPAQQEG